MEARPNQRPRHELLVRMVSLEGVHGRSQSQKEGGGLRSLKARLLVETVASLKGLRRVVDVNVGTEINVAPDGSALFTRDVGTQEIYALDVKWP